jgi:hypothetical protein
MDLAPLAQHGLIGSCRRTLGTGPHTSTAGVRGAGVLRAAARRATVPYRASDKCAVSIESRYMHIVYGNLPRPLLLLPLGSWHTTGSQAPSLGGAWRSALLREVQRRGTLRGADGAAAGTLGVLACGLPNVRATGRQTT